MDASNAGSNRTFMELKPQRGVVAVGLTYRSNRTFMELKRISDNIVNSSLVVLIVPLWN